MLLCSGAVISRISRILILVPLFAESLHGPMPIPRTRCPTPVAAYRSTPNVIPGVLRVGIPASPARTTHSGGDTALAFEARDVPLEAAIVDVVSVRIRHGDRVGHVEWPRQQDRQLSLPQARTARAGDTKPQADHSQFGDHVRCP